MSATWKAKKGPTAPGAQSCTVRLLDGTDVLLDITKKADGQALFEQIIRRLEITQKEYFGLEFEDDHKIPQWLDLTKPLKKQIKRTPYKLTFKVRYYPLDPMISRPSSRTHFYQQVRRDIIDGALRCPNQLTPGLLSYVLQADLGDYESMDADIEYMCDERLVSNEDITLQEEISHSHKLLKGTNPQQSVSGFLRKVREMDNYGTTFHDVKYKDGYCRVGVSPNGLSLYQRTRRIECYDWTRIVEVSFKGKKLTVIVKDEKDLEKVLVLEKDSSKAAKELWNICVVNAGFYSTPNHRAKEEPEANLRSPVAIPPTMDMFGYPIDSLDEPHGTKLKKSRSLPRKLPSDDPVLTAAMSHRGSTKQPDRYDDTDTPDLRNEPQTVDNMQLFLPDMPHILNQDDVTSVPHRLATSHEHAQGVPNHRGDRSHVLQHDGLGRDHHSNGRSHDPPQDGHSRREGLKSGSSSRLSKSSRSSNLSQDDDMDGSLLDLADELGDEKEELVSVAPEGRETERGIMEEPHPMSSPQKSPVVLNSKTLPRSFHSPKNTPPITDGHPHHRSPYKDDNTHSPKHKHGVSPYKEEQAPRHSPTTKQHKRSSQTTGREHKKKKDGKSLVRQWVQEQQLRSFQPSHTSQDSSSSSSIGGNLEHFQHSPEIRVLHATPPSTLTSQSTSQPSPLMQGPPKPPRNYYPDSSELYDHISSNSKTLPSPKKDRRAPNTSPNRNDAFQKPESPLLQYKSSEAIYPTQSRESNTVTSNYKQSNITPDPIREVDDLVNELTANNENFVHPTRHTSGSKLEYKSRGNEPNLELERFRRASDSKVEQARYNRRASERKLLTSQKVVNQLLSENREDDIGVFSHDIEPRRKHVQIAEHESQFIDDNAPLLVDNWFDKSPEPQVQEGTEGDLSGWTDATRVTSPTNFRTIMDEVREREIVPRPPAHLVALSQEMEAELFDLRSPGVSSRSGFTSPPLLPPSSVSSYSSPLHAGVEHLQSIDLNVTDKTVMNDFRPPSATEKLPPVIASFLSRVRQSSTEPADSSDGAISPPLDETIERKESINQASILKVNSTDEGRRNSRPVSPLVAIPPTYDSPRLVRMQMSPTIKVSPHTFDEETSKTNTLKSTDTTHRQWIDDDNHLETKKSIKTPSFVSSANAHPSTIGTASTNYSSDASVTITTSSSDAVVYDTPRAARKQYQTSVVYPEAVTREPNKRSSFIENDKSTGLMKYAQRNADPLQEQKQFAHTWNTNYFDEPETKQVGHSSSQQRRSTEPTVALGPTPIAYRPPPSPITPLTPMSQHTHSDLAPNMFTYPNRANLPPSQSHEVVKSTQFQQPPPFTSSGTTQGHNTRPETGQPKSYNQANPRSRNYRPPSQGGNVGGDVRRTQTFSTGRDSGWSNRYQHEEQRQTISPISDDSLPNSPTYFITNNPNDDRDTPSPATQAQNASFQEHLKELEVKGSRKLRVLDWMKQSSTKSNSQTKRSQDKVPMKKDTNMSVPTKPYLKQAPVYASIDDLDESAHTREPKSVSRPGSGRQTGVQRTGSIPASGNRQLDPTRQREIEAQREFERQRIKLSSHSATGYDMEQRHRGSVPSRPYSRQAADQRRVEMERRATVADTRPGSQVQRRANTFSYPNSQFQPPVSQGGLGDSRSTNRAPTSSTGPTNNPGYPTTKYSGKDYYVIDV